MTNPERAKERMLQKLAEFDVGSWRLAAHGDGWDSSRVMTHWVEWEHQDGRQAIENADGRCSDPELEALLWAQTGELEEQQRPWALSVAATALRWWWPGLGQIQPD